MPRFRGTARDQIRPLGASRADILRIALRSAFTPGQPVRSADRLAGRADALASLIEAIEEQRLHPVIYGERGIGKTSLIHVLAEAAREADYLVFYESCDADTRFDDMFRSVLARIPQLYHADVAPAGEAASAGHLLDMVASGDLSPRSVSELLSHVAGIRVILMLDEFDRAASSCFRRNVAELIKNLSDRCARVQFLIAGVAGDLAELVDHVPSIRRNIFPLALPRMNDAEIDLLLSTGAEASGMRFDAAARLRIRTMAKGSPYVAALLAHQAGLACLAEGEERVTVAHVIAAAARAQDALGAWEDGGHGLALAG